MTNRKWTTTYKADSATVHRIFASDSAENLFAEANLEAEFDMPETMPETHGMVEKAFNHMHSIGLDTWPGPGHLQSLYDAADEATKSAILQAVAIGYVLGMLEGDQFSEEDEDPC